MVKCKKDSPKAINKGKSVFGEIVEIVKYKNTALKPLTNGKVPFGR